MAKNNINENEEIVVAAKVLEQPIEKAIHDYMMPYAESVILDRALPRVEDGLKPVQRRILYTMHELNMRPEGQYKKSARIVGDCLGKYHPHGDSSVYDAMVNMAQDFGMRNVLVDGNGNFGSIDGDPAAAMRYTEVKMAPLAVELLKDLDKDTVNWVNNFDDTLQEPEVLPGRFPNILVNGAQGIAIGLATTIPTHNLTEVIDGVVAYIDNPKITLEELLTIVKGPDFPTGGFVTPVDSFEEIYRTGRGKIMIRSTISIENEGGKQTIVVHEIPYLVNKGRLQVQIKEAKEKDIEKNGKNALLNGITDIVDESDRNGIRLAIKLKKGEDAQKILEYLYKKTSLQTSMSYNIMVIAEGRPQQLGLIPILRYYVEHQRNVVLRRTKFDLNNNKKRAHILEGYSLILGNIDEVIAIIKGSRTRTEAKEGLISRFELSDKQADAILDLKLANITKLEIDKVNTELVEINKKIREFEKIVNSKAEQLKVVKQEILELRNKYRVKRLTTIVDTFDNFDSTQLAVTNNAGDKRGYVVCGVKGDIKLVGNVQFLNNPGRTKPKKIQDMIKCQVFTDPSKQSFAFTDLGNCIKLDLSQMVEVRPGEDGAMPNAVASQLDTKEKFIKVLILTPEDENKNLVFYTQNGMIKKTQVNEYFINRQVFEAITLKDDDKVINVELEDESKGVLEIASNGYCLVYMPTEVNPTGRRTAGVAGMKLDKNSRVICAKQIILDDIENVPVGEVLFVCKTGYAKRAYGYEINLTKRANKGTEMIRVDNNEEIIYSDIVTNAFDVAIADENENVNVVNSEDIGIDRHVRRKGQALAIALNAIYAIKQDSEV